jgi:uncharacterized membrane protein YphA (DoxX/SURF4 family)
MKPMRANPFCDIWLFLIGETGPHLGVGYWRYLLVALFWAALIASIVIARRNWREDPSQRTATHFWTWFFRVSIGTMWFEGSLWKLPIPSGGFRYWLEQVGQYAAFEFHRDLVANVFLPNFTLINTLVFLAEIGMALSFMLGFAVRGFAALGMLMALHLYFGLYRHPSEWPWLFIFLIFVQGLFLMHAAGWSLGFDALRRRRQQELSFGDGMLASAYRLVS